MNNFGPNGIIAATRTEEDFSAALKSSVSCIFLLSSNILTIKEYLDRAHNAGKKVFVHIDMSDGIGRDNAGVAYLSKIGVDGIITTRTGIIRAAKENSIPCVQRIFAIDNQATQTSVGAICNQKPTYIEIMPGVITKVVEKFARLTDIPIIVGGLVETAEEIENAKKSGAFAASTSNRELW